MGRDEFRESLRSLLAAPVAGMSAAQKVRAAREVLDEAERKLPRRWTESRPFDFALSAAFLAGAVPAVVLTDGRSPWLRWPVGLAAGFAAAVAFHALVSWLQPRRPSADQ